MNEPAEAFESTDFADGWCRRWLARLRWLQLERAVRPVLVVVLDVLAQDAFEVAAVEDQQPVQALGANGSDEPFGDGVRLRRSCRRLDDPDAVRAEHLVEGSLYLLSRSRISRRKPWSAKSRPRLRACWVTHAPVGLAVQPANQTRRVAWAMKNNT